MRTRFLVVSVITLVFLFSLIGCAEETPTVPAPGSPQPVATDSVAISPILPTEAPVLHPRDVTPAPGLGMVRGTLVLGGEPAEGRTLYLAALISTGEQIDVAALDAVNDPRAISDVTGYFFFLDIEPGRYGLGIASPIGPILIRRADEGEIMADVLPDQVTDLGEVVIVPFSQ